MTTISNDTERNEAAMLRDRLRAARSRVYVMTVQEASDLEMECRRIGLPSMRHDGGNVCGSVEDHFDDCAARLAREIDVWDRAQADEAREAAAEATEQVAA